MIKQIVAKKHCFLYKEPVHRIGGSELPGSRWGVDEIIEEIDGGEWLKVRLSYGSGVWWVRAEDWDFVEPNATQPHRITYYSQKDNYTQANRTCFSSVSAMLLKFYLPDAIDTDDDYLRTVIKCGDTTEAATQLMALRSYGLNPVFAKNWTLDKLKETVCRKPVGIGLLHRSNYLNPTGGHWVLCHGYDYNTKQFLIQDPWESDYDWQAGVYDSVTPGKDQVWPEEALHYRYTVEAKDGHLHSGFSLWID